MVCYSEPREITGPWVQDFAEIEDGMLDTGGRLIAAGLQEWNYRRNDSTWKLSMWGSPLVKVGDIVGLKIETLPLYLLQCQEVSGGSSNKCNLSLGMPPANYQRAFNAMSDLQGAFVEEYLTTDGTPPTCDPSSGNLTIGEGDNGTPFTFTFTPGNPGTYNSPRIILDLSFEYYMSLGCELILSINGHSGDTIPELRFGAWAAKHPISFLDITQWAVATENTVSVYAKFAGSLEGSQTIKVTPSVKIVRRTPLA